MRQNGYQFSKGYSDIMLHYTSHKREKRNLSVSAKYVKRYLLKKKREKGI